MPRTQESGSTSNKSSRRKSRTPQKRSEQTVRRVMGTVALKEIRFVYAVH